MIILFHLVSYFCLIIFKIVLALKNFIQLCDSPEEDAQLMVKEYLNAGGSAFELVNALDKDVKNIALAAHVFSSVNIVVMT